GTSLKSGAMEGRAATVIVVSGEARWTSAIAGSAITASPSQFGARTTRCVTGSRLQFFSSLAVALNRRKHARRAVGRPVLSPAPMHPQPEIGPAADLHLEHVRTTLRELLHGVYAVGARRLDGMLVDHTIAPCANGQRKHRYDRRAGSKRQRRERRCGSGRPL